MQLSFNTRASASAMARSPGTRSCRLSELAPGESAVIDRIDLPADMAHRLMELGFLPGMTVTVAHSAPGGDPRVFRVDGSEIALRRETAAGLHLKM
jgi:Fe2+ transport system protein FeoA